VELGIDGLIKAKGRRQKEKGDVGCLELKNKTGFADNEGR
jgi:hypothetical protein